MKSIQTIIFFLALFLMHMPSNGYSVNREIEEQSAGTAVVSPEISVPSGCVTSVNPGSVSFEDVGGTIFIEVLRQDANCTFTISEQAWWLSIQNETFRGFDIVCSPNEMAASRSATVNVDGINVTVTQKGVVINSYNVTGGGTSCSDGDGVNVGLDGSDTGVSYALRRDVTTTVLTLSGTGSALDFGKQTVSGTYTVVASKNGLNQTMDESATVVAEQSPGVFNFSGGGEITPCVSSLSFELDGTENGTLYALYRDGNQVASTTGTGNPLLWSGLNAVGNYTAIAVSPGGCQSDMPASGSTSISIQPDLTSGGIGGTKTICYNSPAGTLNGTAATGGGGLESYEYKWWESTDNSNWIPINSTNVVSYEPPGTLTSTRYYRRTISDGCVTKYSNVVTISVYDELGAGSIIGTQGIPYNSQPDSLIGSPATGGSGNYEYTWYESHDNSTWTPIDNSNVVSYLPGVLTQSTWYYREVMDLEGCGSANSYGVKVAVFNPPAMPDPATEEFSAGETVLTRPDPPANETYYWEPDTISTLRTDSGKTKTFTSFGIYYLRSYHNLSHLWSEARSGKVKVYPGIPGEPVASYSNGQTILTLPTVPWDQKCYWQQDSTSTSMTDSLSTKTFTADSVYYLRSHNYLFDSWSPTRAGDVKVYTQPDIPPKPDVIMESGKTTVSLAGIDIPAGETYYWQTTPGGELTNDSSTVKEFISPTTLYLRSRLDGPSYLWSDALQLDIQVTSGGGTAYSDMNYISQIVIRQEGITNESSITSLTATQKSETVGYYDGLGRLAQEVQVKASPSQMDLVRPVHYDAYGREIRKFLAYPGMNSNGAYVPSDLTEQAAYFSSIYDSDGTTAFAETRFDNSPLNRVMEQGAPGADWQPGQHTVKYSYGTNAAGEVGLWEIVTDWYGDETLENNGYYDAGTLYKTTTWDENHSELSATRTEEFKDKLGRVLLKVAWNDTIPSRTAYVYDDFGLLRFVLTPEAMAASSIGSSELDDYCYQYWYDGRKRMIEKKLPGVESVCMVYDKRDRLVAIQDGNMWENDQWLFTKYDALNRPVMTGIISLASDDQASLQSYLDSYEGDYYELKTSSGIGYTLGNSFAGKFNINENNLLTVTYYDRYDYPGYKIFDGDANISGYSDISDDPRYFDVVRGQVTGTREKILDGNELTSSGIWLLSTTYYDDRYRVIETISDLYPQSSGNYEVTSSKYNFTGDVLQSQTVQSFQGNTNSVLELYNYDHVGRLTEIQYNLNNSPDPVTLSSMEYDELGQLKRKTLNGAPGAGVQELNYAYNIRGWLSQINDPEIDPGSGSQQKFNMALYYNTVPSGLTADPQYNGNISGMVWNTPNNSGALSPTGKQGYGYTYDGLNRLKTANYGEDSNFATNAGANNVTITGYDRNGNIRGLTRQLKGSGEIDNLSYGYQGNQLLSVNDAANENVGFTEMMAMGYEYDYDSNGNMIMDANKGFEIQYNYLNLPRQVNVYIQNISYIYTAGGTKVSKVQADGSTLYYAGNFVYQGSSLKYILNEEGMVTTPSNPVYLYSLKDHLGNIRLEVNNSGTVTQQTDYYPFGMALKIAGSSDNKYLYNGKELQDDALFFGMVTLGWYDYGARFYDPALGRWHTVDPKNQFASSYVAMANNPVRYIDPNGMKVTETDSSYQITGDDVQIYLASLQNVNGQESYNNFLEALSGAAEGYNGYHGFRNTVLGVSSAGGGKTENATDQMSVFKNYDAYANYMSQQKKKAYFSYYYSHLSSDSKDVMKLMGVFLSPLLVAEAPAYMSYEYAGAKFFGSAAGQYITTGQVDWVDATTDAVITNPILGAAISSTFNFGQVGGKYTFSITSSPQRALSSFAGNLFLGSGNSYMSRVANTRLGSNLTGRAAQNIFNVGNYFGSETLNGIYGQTLMP